jgi:hypothetical protein
MAINRVMQSDLKIMWFARLEDARIAKQELRCRADAHH